MERLPMSRGYLIAPILVPSLHVLFTPLWAVLGGQAELALLAMCWQLVAWFGLTAVCLATFSPALWIARKSIAGVPHKVFKKLQKLMVAFIAAAMASFFLMGPYPMFRSIPVAWLCGYIAAVCFLSALYKNETIAISSYERNINIDHRGRL